MRGGGEKTITDGQCGKEIKTENILAAINSLSPYWYAEE